MSPNRIVVFTIFCSRVNSERHGLHGIGVARMQFLRVKIQIKKKIKLCIILKVNLALTVSERLSWGRPYVRLGNDRHELVYIAFVAVSYKFSFRLNKHSQVDTIMHRSHTIYYTRPTKDNLCWTIPSCLTTSFIVIVGFPRFIIYHSFPTSS